MTNKEFLIERIGAALADYEYKDEEVDYRLVLRALRRFVIAPDAEFIGREESNYES